MNAVFRNCQAGCIALKRVMLPRHGETHNQPVAPYSRLFFIASLIMALMFPMISFAEDGDSCRSLKVNQYVSRLPAGDLPLQPTGPLGDAMRALFNNSCPNPYVGFETYESVLKQVIALVEESDGEMTLTSYNQFVNGVCDIGEACDAFIAANPTFFDNEGDGPFDLRPFGRSGLDPKDPMPVGRRDLLLLRAGIKPPTDAEDIHNEHKVMVFWLGQHGDEWFLNYDAVIRLLKKMDDDFLENHTLYVALMPNPDGTDVVDRGDGDIRPQRRNSNNDLENFSHGADLNRWHFPQNICSVNSDTNDTNPATGEDYCQEDGDAIASATIYTRAPETLGMTQVYKTIRGDMDPNDGVNHYTITIDHVADLHGQGADRADCTLIFNPTLQKFMCDPADKTGTGEVAIRANIGTIITDGGVDIIDDKPVYQGNTLIWQIPELKTKLTREVDALAKAIVVSVNRRLVGDSEDDGDENFRLHKYGRTNITGVGGYGRGSTSYSYEGSPSYLLEMSGIRHHGSLVREIQNWRSFKILRETLDAITSERYLDIIDGDPKNAQRAYQQELGEPTGTFDQVGTRNQSSSVHNPDSFGFLTRFLDIVPIECECGRSGGKGRFISDPRLITGPTAFSRCLYLQQINPAPDNQSPLPYCDPGSTEGNCINPGGACKDPNQYQGLEIADCEDGVTDVEGYLFCK